MQISFYVLNDNPQRQGQSATDALQNFVCNLTQKVLEKSEQTLIILDDNQQRLKKLDEQLWGLSPTSFLPHDLLIEQKKTDSVAPVILTDKLPMGFDGVVLNLAGKPLNVLNPDMSNIANAPNTLSISNNTTEQDEPVHRPSRLLEIIPADSAEKEKGRAKYKHYQSLGFVLDYYPIG